MGIFREMDGLPVTIRLLDPPLHEFLPSLDQTKQIEELASDMGIAEQKVRDSIGALHELNPMLGFRGCRLGVVFSEIYEMQTKAIFEAACELVREGVNVMPEVMIPLVGTTGEIEMIREYVVRVADETIKEYGVDLDYMVGTMIEVPRAALVADKIAESAEFFSFGTNDMTQMVSDTAGTMQGSSSANSLTGTCSSMTRSSPWIKKAWARWWLWVSSADDLLGQT